MKFIVKHDGASRIRIHILQRSMTFEQADTLEYYLTSLSFVKKAKVYDKTQDAAISYTGNKDRVIKALQEFNY